MHDVRVYTEYMPEHYAGDISITIQCRKSEFDIEYDLVSALYDVCANGINEHPHLKDIAIRDYRHI